MLQKIWFIISAPFVVLWVIVSLPWAALQVEYAFDRASKAWRV